MRGVGIKLRSKTSESEVLPKPKKSLTMKYKSQDKKRHFKLDQYPRSLNDYFTHIQSKVLFQKMAQITYHTNNFASNDASVKEKYYSQNKSERIRSIQKTPNKYKEKNPQNLEPTVISYENQYLQILRKTQHFKTTFLVNSSHWKDKIMRRKNIGSYGQIYKGRAKPSQICSFNLIKPQIIQNFTRLKTQEQQKKNITLQTSYNCKTINIQETHKEAPQKYKISLQNVQKMRKTCGDNLIYRETKNRKQSVNEKQILKTKGKSKNQGWVFEPW